MVQFGTNIALYVKCSNKQLYISSGSLLKQLWLTNLGLDNCNNSSAQKQLRSSTSATCCKCEICSGGNQFRRCMTNPMFVTGQIHERRAPVMRRVNTTCHLPVCARSGYSRRYNVHLWEIDDYFSLWRSVANSEVAIKKFASL